VVYGGILRLPRGDANTVFKCVEHKIKSDGLEWRQVVGLGADGCSVLAGHKNGVAAQMKARCPYNMWVQTQP